MADKDRAADGEQRAPGLKFAVVGVLGMCMLRLLRFSWRVTEEPADLVRRRQRERGDGPGTVYAMWHSHLLMGAALQAYKDTSVVVSQHADGEYIARPLELSGARTIRGSSTRGGARVLMRAVKVLRSGGDVAFTADGPKGPRLRVKAGCVVAAMRSGAPIVCVAFGWRRARRLQSWDRFVFAYPFTHVTNLWSEPIHVPPDLDPDGIEEWRLRIETTMLELTARAAEREGQPIETPDEDPLHLGTLEGRHG